jgi:hypothetical protein
VKKSAGRLYRCHRYLKEEPENRIAGFLLSVLLKYKGKSFSSDEYGAQRLIIPVYWYNMDGTTKK